MAMPTDLVIVRHGHSEGNLAMGRSKKGDDSFVTSAFRETPGHQWRLTADGRDEAKLAGEWIQLNISGSFDRYYASPFVRTMETAALLGFAEAEWRLDQRLRERDWGEINSMPPAEHHERYPQNALVKKIDALYWRPPAGESIADVRLRVRNFFDTMHRECEGQSVILVTHGEFMSAARAALEYMSDEDWVERDHDSSWKIKNTHVYHYSRRDPLTGEISKYISFVRRICPSDPQSDSRWLPVARKRFSNDALLEQVGRIDPIIRRSPAPSGKPGVG